MVAMDVEERARKMAGYWISWGGFVWSDPPEDSAKWCIYYTHNRDSRLLEQSNASAIRKALAPLIDAGSPDIREEDHGHWAVGWVKGFAIRVFTVDGQLTAAFRLLAGLLDRLDDYPILDEDDYSRRESEATYENVLTEGRRLVASTVEGEDWVSTVLDYWESKDPNALESTDDQGGYLTSDQITEALKAKGVALAEDED